MRAARVSSDHFSLELFPRSPRCLPTMPSHGEPPHGGTMASNRLRRYAARALIVVSAAIIGVALAVLAATSDVPSKPGPSAHEGALIAAPIPPPDEPAPSASIGGTVPARAPAPAGVTCPADWSYFDNPVVHYGVCVPPGWGFSDFRSSNALDRVPAVEL